MKPQNRRSSRFPHIARFEVKGFRSCRYTAFSPEPGLTSLVGVNASGKSNLLQAILLLKQLARGHVWKPRSSPGALPCEIRATFSVRGKTIDYKAKVLLSMESGSGEEVEAAEEAWNFRTVTGRDRWVEFPMRYLTTEMRPRFKRTLRPIPRGYYYDPRVRVRGFGIPPRLNQYVESIASLCSRMAYYSASRFTNPSACPSSFEIDSAGDLAGYRPTPHVDFLFALYRCSTQNRALYDQYMAIVGIRGIGLIDRVIWKAIKAPTRAVRVRPGGAVVRETRKQLIVIPTIVLRGFTLTPNQLSEGTFRSLALIFHLLSPESDLVLLEEPEVCVHHGLLSSLVEVIKNCSARKQVIFSTHSDFILDALEPEQVQIVRYSEKGGTIVRKLPEAMGTREFSSLKRYLRESGNLGEYWRQRRLL